MQTVLIGGESKILCRVPPMARVPMVRHSCSIAPNHSSSALQKYDQQKIASSGIAPNLLNGGQTGQSAFQVLLDIHEKPDAMCNIKKSGMITVL
ncbi:hypothetical protein TNCV_2588161 [Trichonephila clavipes]|nr:hypothetical protein TNCV_2588161 [Trichonephila clavipes]